MSELHESWLQQGSTARPNCATWPGAGRSARFSTKFASPFFYAVGDHQLEHGEPLAWIGVLAGTTALFALGAALAFNRLDVH